MEVWFGRWFWILSNINSMKYNFQTIHVVVIYWAMRVPRTLGHLFKDACFADVSSFPFQVKPLSEPIINNDRQYYRNMPLCAAHVHAKRM